MRATAGFAIFVIACKHDVPIETTATHVESDPVITSASSVTSSSARASVVPPAPTPCDEDTAKCVGELGYAQLQAGKLDEALESSRRALTLSPSASLESQIEFNVGLVYEKKGDAERARAAFARANAKRSSTASRAKLAGKSMCPAAVVREPFVSGAEYTLTTSWRDVYAFAAARGSNLLASPHDWTLKPASDADAKKLLASDCSGAPPWSIPLGHLMFSDSSLFVAPVSAGRMVVVDGGMNGGGCTGMGARPSATTSAKLSGAILSTTSTVDWWTDVSCKAGSAHSETTTTFYDPDALRVITIGAAAALSGRTITIALPGCDPITL